MVLILFFAGLVFFATPSYSSDRFFLCGPDEDGCFEGMYPSCFCIPYNDIEANAAYCLDFNELKCTPLSQTTHCNSYLIYKNQSECLATIFQSEPRPPCTITTLSFCIQEHTIMCDPSGQLSSCQK